jgi:hypothetical protein
VTINFQKNKFIKDLGIINAVVFIVSLVFHRELNNMTHDSTMPAYFVIFMIVTTVIQYPMYIVEVIISLMRAKQLDNWDKLFLLLSVLFLLAYFIK